MFWDGDGRNINFGGGGNDLGWDTSSHWDAVDLVWSGDQSQAGCELLDEDCALSSVDSGEQDANGAWGEGCSEGSLVGGKALLAVSFDCLSDRQGWVELWLTDGGNLAGYTCHVL